jgi:hypothetical protein
MFVILFILLQLQSTNNSKLLNDARNNFLQVTTLDAAEYKGEEWLSSSNVNLQAYGACMYFMQARFVKNPITKWSRFKKGKKKLDGLIQQSPENIEMRYLRFIFQSEMPEFLGYHENKEEDFEFIIQQIESFEAEENLKCVILNNVSNVEQLTLDKKLVIDKKLEKCS